MEWGEPEPHCPLVSGAGAGGLTPSGTARGHQQRPGHAPQLWAPSPRVCVLRVLPGEGSIKDVTAAFGFQPSLLPTGLPFFPGGGGALGVPVTCASRSLGIPPPLDVHAAPVPAL